MADRLTIDATDLRKRYGAVDALCGLALGVPAGSIYGFLGRNGAGKTTTLKVLLGMARPDAGEARVFGLDATKEAASVDIRRRTAFVSEEKDLYDYMTVDEMIHFTSSFYPRWRKDLAARYRRTFDLPGDRKGKALSRGTRTKLALLLALCRGAELLILDEPTSGLDPAVSEEVLQALVSYVDSAETTVFFSSHQIAEVDQIADHVTIVDRGRAIVQGALDDVRARYRSIQLVFDGDAPAVTFRAPGVVRAWREHRVLTVLSSAGADEIVDEARGLNPVSVAVTPLTLKDIFLETVMKEK